MRMEFTTVQTRNGRLRGKREGDGAVFLGIPYAAPPVGTLRWRPPQPLPAWSGVRDALAFGADVPQPAGGLSRATHQDEDCLFLNVWTPRCERGARLPVVVWLFGGGFTSGSGADPLCDGAALAAEGAVVVTLNYRCGLFGFLAHPGLSANRSRGSPATMACWTSWRLWPGCARTSRSSAATRRA
jgi:para-nitrobenzyl esterase